ncbi:ribosomal-protein-alanine N-acetyltransferase [Psychrobacillus psychrotolerans]|uniref:Ribosomal-protein-alanine N-acetyltransferase n=2 Tax=Psychrobacillus psychrotolerans TaxID=126156 RepID=A0A1I5UYM3_9BACI|nr:GNAT family N-acetyltransferase [Psychrobacillus psychrotolerans]SFQ00147.1 ribosomal-protein-alanine N-acetyltransferase [Psychrobacillus psychrotolerans]
MNNLNLLLVKHNQMESERLLLRPITLNDAEDMFEYTSDEETTRFIYEHHKDLEQTKNLIANYFVKEPIGKYAIVLRESNKMVGAIEFRVDDWNKSGDLGFTLNRHYWGKGYMTEAGKLILSLAFNVMGLERVFSAHEVKNSASGKVLDRLGMKCEGILRKNQMIKGQLVDSVHYSILKEEYLDS